MLLQVVKLPRSTFYYHCARQGAGEKHAHLKEQITQIFVQNKERYGYRRVHAQLGNQGFACNHKLVRRLMLELGLKSPVRRKKFRHWRGDLNVASPNLLERKFNALKPNEKWVTDVTEFNVEGEKLFLSPVMDLYNGEIIAYEMHTRPQYQLVSNMLDKALERLSESDKPIIHSDQGWQYRMPAYRKTLAKRQCTQSMSRKANCLDNAAMESFFALLQKNVLDRRTWCTREQLRIAIVTWIERTYHRRRRQARLGRLTPLEYETIMNKQVALAA